MNHKLLPPLAALRAFEAVGRLGGVRKAGKELEIDHAVISRHIRTLESLIGKNLLVRESTGYQLTDDGQVYHQEIYKALTTIATATARLTETTERKKLRIWCIPGFASLWLSDRLGDFIKHHPSIDLDFRPADASPDFRSKEVDGDIRYLRRWEEAAVPKVAYKLEFARPLVYRAAWSVTQGDPDASTHVSMAKALASDAATLTANQALQCHGAIGYSYEYDLHLFMKRAWALGATWGDAAWHRARVGRAIL